MRAQAFSTILTHFSQRYPRVPAGLGLEVEGDAAAPQAPHSAGKDEPQAPHSAGKDDHSGSQGPGHVGVGEGSAQHDGRVGGEGKGEGEGCCGGEHEWDSMMDDSECRLGAGAACGQGGGGGKEGGSTLGRGVEGRGGGGKEGEERGAGGAERTACTARAAVPVASGCAAAQGPCTGSATKDGVCLEGAHTQQAGDAAAEQRCRAGASTNPAESPRACDRAPAMVAFDGMLVPLSAVPHLPRVAPLAARVLARVAQAQEELEQEALRQEQLQRGGNAAQLV